MPERVGILGGTFNPVHIGHLRIAEEAFEALNLDRLVLIPAADPPHKTGRRIPSFEARCRMLDLSIRSNPHFSISDIEQKMEGKSYSVLTLRRLREESRGREEYFFLVGADSFLELETWYRYRELFSLAHIVVVGRPGYEGMDMEARLHNMVSREYRRCPDGLYFQHPHLLSVHFVNNTLLGISSTTIRRLVAAGKSIRYLVADDVMRYIDEENLYGENLCSFNSFS